MLAGNAEVDAARRGNRGVVADDAARELAQVHRRERPLGDAGLLARERQQLLDEMRRAGEARLELGERAAPLRLGRRALGDLRLQVHGGERRAQFVRGVGDECALRAERAVEPAEQAVERVDERLHLGGQPGFGERLEHARRALGQAPPRRDRADAGSRAMPNQTSKRQQRRDRQQRHDRAQRHARGELAPHAHRLRDLHDALAGRAC